MGNQFSINKPSKGESIDISEPKSSYEIIDFIATYYILTADYVSLTKLYDREYCNKLVVLTSDIIERYFTNLEITYLAQRTKEGVIINEMTKDKIIFFNKDALKNADIQNALKKKRVCQGIAKFYIKIAHIFATIVRTVNPVYVYKDADGDTVRANLYERGTIPEGVPREMHKMNICDMRINALRGKEDYTKLGENDPMIIHPDICSMNINDSGEIKNLMEEPGIPELEHLYYDDGYNYETGKFEKMSEQASKQYADDLQIFHEYFTGKVSSDNPINKFSDIKLRDFDKTENFCLNEVTQVSGKLSDELFAKYADNLRRMIDNANLNQDKLTDIINKLFTYTIDPQTKKKVVRVNPTLTEDGLQEVVVDTRALVIKLYLTCEQDFEEGVSIYKAIVEKLSLDTTTRQTSTLSKEIDKELNEELNEEAENNLQATKPIETTKQLEEKEEEKEKGEEKEKEKEKEEKGEDPLDDANK